MPKRRKNHHTRRVKDRDRPVLFLRDCDRVVEAAPVEPVFNIGACEGCPAYRSEMPHEPDQGKGSRIFCNKVRKMVPVQINISTHQQCPVFKTKTAEVRVADVRPAYGVLVC